MMLRERPTPFEATLKQLASYYRRLFLFPRKRHPGVAGGDRLIMAPINDITRSRFTRRTMTYGSR